jgi:hypothetical protein
MRHSRNQLLSPAKAETLELYTILGFAVALSPPWGPPYLTYKAARVCYNVRPDKKLYNGCTKLFDECKKQINRELYSKPHKPERRKRRLSIAEDGQGRSSIAAQHRFPFMKLPVELRLQIYHEMIGGGMEHGVVNIMSLNGNLYSKRCTCFLDDTNGPGRRPRHMRCRHETLDGHPGPIDRIQ